MPTIQRHDRNRANQSWLLAVFAIALLIRGGIVFFSPHAFAADPDAYRALAETLADQGVYGIAGSELPARPTAFRPPLYPYLLSWLTPSESGRLSVLAVAIWHVVMGAITALLSSWIASRLIEANRVGAASVVAGLLVAVDPLLVNQSTELMTETLATLIATAAIAWWVGQVAATDERRGSARFVVLGGLLALAYLCRPTFLVWAAMMVACSFFVGRQIRFASRLTQMGLTAILVVAALVGWTWRNTQSVGHPIWATSHGGYTLLLANNPSFYDYLRDGKWGQRWDSQPFLEAYVHRYDGDATQAAFWDRDWSHFQSDPDSPPTDATEYEDDQYCYRAARATIDRQRAMFVWSCAVRAARLWTPFPHRVADRAKDGTTGRVKERGGTIVVVVGLYYTAMYLAIGITLWRLRKRIFRSQWWVIWTLAITLSGVHAVYWTNMRMRAPIIPAMAVLAVGVIAPSRRAGETTSEDAIKERSDVAHD